MSDHDLLNLPGAVIATLDGSRPVSAARRRKVHAGHFAFMRTLVQGVEPGQAWERHMPAEGAVGDRRLIRSTIAWIKEEFSAAAKREDRFGTAAGTDGRRPNSGHVASEPGGLRGRKQPRPSR